MSLADSLDIVVVRELKELPGFLSNAPIFCDTETDGLFGTLITLQLYQPQLNEKIYIVECVDISLKDIQELLKPLHSVWYNAHYDLTCLQIVPERFEDGFVLAKLKFYDAPSFSLDVIAKHIGYPTAYEGLDKKKIRKTFTTQALENNQYKYAAVDVYVLHKIYELCVDILPLQCYKLDIISLKYALVYQNNGIPINKAEVLRLIEECQTKLNTLTEGSLKGINYNSPKQCKELLHTPNSDKLTLLTLINQGNTLAKDIYDARRLAKKLNMLQSYAFDRVYSRFNPVGASSGRFTASSKGVAQGINAQQIPRALKYLVRSNDPTKAIIELDYSTIELRLAAALYGDVVMRDSLLKGVDLHTFTAQTVTGKKDITKEERTFAKIINFGFVYGMSAKAFVNYAFMGYDINVSQAEAEEVRKKYFAQYKDLQRHHDYIWKNYDKPKFFVKTALGRCVKPKLGTDAINTPVQGTGAECLKLAIHYVLEKHPELIHSIINVVHDSLVLEVPANKAEEIAEEVKTCMFTAWKKLCNSPVFKFKDIPIDVGVEITQPVKPEETATSELIIKDIDLDEFGNILPDNRDKIALIDADTLAYTSALVGDIVQEALPKEFYSDKEWKDIINNPTYDPVKNTYVVPDLQLALEAAEQKLEKILKYSGCEKCELHFTKGKSSFRYYLSKTYKATRVTKPPTQLLQVKDYLVKKYNGFVWEDWEADDVVVYYKTTYPEKYILCCVDKDVYNSTPGVHFNYYESGVFNKSMGFMPEVTQAQATMWIYKQAIIGDKSDNIKGCPGIGEKRVSAYIYEGLTKDQLKANVIKAFKDAGATKEEALNTLRLVDMHTLYEKNGELCLKEEFLPKDMKMKTKEVTKQDTGIKYDANKLRYDLIPPVATKALAEVLTYGAQKYEPNGWQKVEKDRYIAAAWRHFEQWREGEVLDKESNLPHLAHLLTNVSFLLWFEGRSLEDIKQEADRACVKCSHEYSANLLFCPACNEPYTE